jgi:large subunit ribosomal protein L25
MELKLYERKAEKKSELNAQRREGFIPAVMYFKGEKALSVAICENEWLKQIHHLKAGRLSSTVITLTDESGKMHKAIIKDVQYHVTTYQILHLDFQILKEGEGFNIRIPIEFSGEADCIGVKLGGILRQVIRKVKVSCDCLKNIPVCFKIDVATMAQRDNRKINAIKFPEGVKPLVDINQVAVVIAKR